MLQHEPSSEQEQPASQVRVKSEELARALASIEARRQEEAQRLEGTVAIGDAVQELQLDATSEEIWTEIQKQRVQAPPHTSAVRTVRLEPQRRPAQTPAHHEHEEDAPIETLHRSTPTDTRVLIGVLLAALLLCLLGLAISLTTTPKPPGILEPPPPVTSPQPPHNNSRSQKGQPS